MAVPTAMQATSTSHEYQGGAGWGEGHGQAVSSAMPATSPSPVTPGGNRKCHSFRQRCLAAGRGRRWVERTSSEDWRIQR